MVGVTGFEPAASSSRTKRATKLRHTPMANGLNKNTRAGGVVVTMASLSSS